MPTVIGTKFSVEHRNKISNALRGKKFSHFRIENMRKAKVGYLPSRKAVELARIVNAGRIPWNKGKRHKPQTIEKMRAIKVGKKFTKEHRMKIGLSHLARPNSVFKDTKIELLLSKALDGRGIKYEKQVSLCKVARVDFYVDDKKVVIQADGCYYHNCPDHFPNKYLGRRERDAKQDLALRKGGLIVYRFWEHDIKSSVERCIDNVAEFNKV